MVAWVDTTRPPTADIRLKMYKIRLNSDSFLAKNQTNLREIQTKIKNLTGNDKMNRK